MVYIHMATGFEEIELTTIVDVLRRGEVKAVIVSVEEKRVIGAHGIAMESDITFDQADYESCQMIVLPGGIPGTPNLQKHKGLEQQILDFAQKGKFIGAMCAAPMILGQLGILEGKVATIYPGMEEYLVGAKVTDQVVAVDGNIITSQAPATAMAFALALLEALKGGEVAKEVAEGMRAI